MPVVPYIALLIDWALYMLLVTTDMLGDISRIVLLA